MMTLGSILGDGSDFRDTLAAERAKKYLNNKNVCDYFTSPQAFIPIKIADGLTQDQQMSFYLPGDTVLLSSFNFVLNSEYSQAIDREQLKLKKNTGYIIKDFLTDSTVGRIDPAQTLISWITEKANARMVKIIPQLK